MGAYKKKPVVIEAFQWTGGPDQTEDPLWIIEAIKKGDAWLIGRGTHKCQMIIKTLEGNHAANIGDYIIKGVKGEIYPCKPDNYEMTYEIAGGRE